MPKVTIWIRKEDYDKWQAIADKPAWLHKHLNNPLIKMAYETERLDYLNKHPDEKQELGGLSFLDDPTIEPFEESA